MRELQEWQSEDGSQDYYSNEDSLTDEDRADDAAMAIKMAARKALRKAAEGIRCKEGGCRTAEGCREIRKRPGHNYKLRLRHNYKLKGLDIIINLN